MDWTHLRFFSLRTIERLLIETGFSIERIVPEICGAKAVLGNRMTLGLLKHLFAYTYNFSAWNRPN